MAVRALVRSPAALVATLAGAVAVGAVVAAGLGVALAFQDASAVANPRFLAGLGQLVYIALFGLIAGLAALVWLPFGAAVARAVGRNARGQSASVAATLRVVLARAEPLYRWTKTRTAVGPLADRVLAEEDVAPTEVLAGATAFVVPAVVLDAPSLPRAVERANRVTPEPGRERLPAACLVATGLLAAGVVGAGLLVGGTLQGASELLAAGTVVFGSVFAVAVDTAWRASVYAVQDLSEGFSG
jgi:hypothetical protein